MNMDMGGMIIDSVTALAAVVGVLVAAHLGRKAVNVARETVDRSARDYAAGRVDILTDLQGIVVQRMAELKADMHVFWKENPDELLTADPESARARELLQLRSAAEVAVHRTMYLLNGACVRLAKAVPAVRMDIDSETVPPAADVSRALASIHLFERSAMPLYFALIASQKVFPSPASNPARFKQIFLGELRFGPESGLIRDEAERWLEEQFETQSGDQLTPAIVAINFIEGFALQTLDSSLECLVDPILETCRPVVKTLR